MYKGKLTRKVKFSYTHTKKLIFQKVLMLEQIWPQTGAPRALVKIVWMQEQICKLIAAYRRLRMEKRAVYDGAQANASNWKTHLGI
nr:uncharacterized protein LOC26530351 isoform X3 [Drosophila virilis]XP_032289109.1 uncharacterized protein LOC116649757 isoform X3 [Drosophila virilis]